MVPKGSPGFCERAGDLGAKFRIARPGAGRVVTASGRARACAWRFTSRLPRQPGHSCQPFGPPRGPCPIRPGGDAARPK